MMLVRPATLADAESIGTIYNEHVTRTTRTLDLVPRSPDEQLAWLKERSGGLVVLVAVDGSEPEDVGTDDEEATQDAGNAGELVGFASFSFYRDRPGYRTSVENSIYVAPGHQGRGIGKALLAELIDVAANHGFHAMFARIVGPSEASMALHRSLGFELVGIEREVARKFSRWHDVALMQRML